MSPRTTAASFLACAGFLLVTAFGSAGGSQRPTAHSVADGCVDDAFEPDDDRAAARPIGIAEAQQHALCDDDWVSFENGANLREASHLPIYLVETRKLTGGADPYLEVYDCYCSGFGEQYELVASDDNGGTGLGARVVYQPRPGLYRPLSYPSLVKTRNASGAPAAGGGYELSVTCVDGCPHETLFVVTAAHARGLEGTFFQTDLTIFNPREVEVSADLFFTPSGTDGSVSRIARTVRVGARRTVQLRDVVGELFGLDSGFGSIEVRPRESDLVVTSRTANTAADPPGSYGFAAAAQRLRDGAGPGETLHILQIGKSDLYRTNVGFCEVLGGGTAVRLRMLDAAGASLGESTFTLPPYGHHQVNDVFGALGVPPRSDVRVTLEPASSGARILGYATVIDNRTSDSYLVPAQKPSNRLPINVIAAAASADGAFGSRWRTDLRIANVWSTAVPYEILFTPAGATGPNRPGETGVLQPGQLVALDDVAARFGGTSGSLTVSPGTSRLAVTSRTYSLSEAGTYGDFIPAHPGIAPEVAFVPLAGSTAAHRVNLGLVNVDPAREVTVTVVSRGGNVLAERAYSGIPGSLQINDVLRQLGASPDDAGHLELRGIYYGATAFVTIIDNRTNDFVYVPAEWLDPAFDQLAVSLPGGVPLVLRRVPSGRFTIGSDAGERGRDADEERHDVTLTRPYYTGRTEVTETQYAAVMGSGERGDRPVRNVSWADVAGPGGFLERLNAHLTATGQTLAGKLRLPTEAEWEVAARGGTTTRYFFGDAPECDDACGLCFPAQISAAWCGNRSVQGPDRAGLDGSPANNTISVFYRTPNAYGLVDMPGNVWEWVSDWYAPFTATPATDPTGPAEGTERVIRGGGWSSELRLCRSANRFSYPPATRNDAVGFRVAVTAD